MKWQNVYYDNEPIGGGNPYSRCRSCKQSDPYVTIEGHRAGCEYVKLAEIRPELERLAGRYRELLGDSSFWAMTCVFALKTWDSGKELLGVFETAISLFETVDNHEDVEAARELAEQMLTNWVCRRSADGY